MNIEHRTLQRRTGIERPTSNNVFCQFKKKIEQHAAQAPALRERIYHSKFDSAELVAGGGLSIMSSA